MFGSLPKSPRPILLILVYGVFVAIVGITASAQAVLVSAHFSTATLNDVVSSDAATVRAFVNAYVEPRHFDRSGSTTNEIGRLEAQLAALTRPGEIVAIELRRPDGAVVAASDPGRRSAGQEATEGVAAAAAGAAHAAVLSRDSRTGAVPSDGQATAGSTERGPILVEHLPLIVDGEVLAVVVISRDAAPVLARLDAVRRDVVLVTLTAGLVAAALLFLIFRAAQTRLTRQTAALMDTTRRDPLTGLLNHGALVGHLAREIETARSTGLPIGVAVVDIDNFRLLNENHGHRAGDEALLAVVGLLRRHLPATILFGRYGPDEILLIAPPAAVAQLEPAIEAVRVGLVDLSLQFEATERLPVTMSAGVCTFPRHGASVTALLSAVARILEEAKASGGDAIRVADAVAETSSGPSGFDIFQGLVLAVDTKDRYTKRHSEDVARYAVFLAEHLGLDPDLVHAIRVCGLLHDVGKIGIPDAILRKPGRLTADEQEVVKQHVALGHMIVRDLPEAELVRTGVRHHHERWDGKGYLDGLAGENIPLIARVIAVGDAFSAMTTTRPYRKALSTRDALTRLGDAAGSQLDERLVRVFITAIERAADPPLLLKDGGSPIWLPRPRVA